MVLAQEGGDLVDEGDAGAGAEEQDAEGTGAEVGAGEEGGEDATAGEGPPWTYQMARLGLLMLLALLAGIGFAYYRFVHQRQKTGF